MLNITKNNEKKITSQNGEDGVLEYIFDNIGTTNKIAVEFGVSSIKKIPETNTGHLISKGWKGFWFDLNDIEGIPSGCSFFKTKLTKDNIENIFQDVGIPAKFDLLSIDIDSNDYWIRAALKSFSPCVYVIEYNGSYDASTEYIMQYDENYIWKKRDTRFGASLKSLEIQGNRLGYDLVYCDQRGINAFFIRKDVNVFKALSSKEAWIPLFWANR